MPYEAKRLEALISLDLLDTPASESFDRITRMASQIFQLPIAAVSLTDADRQWFKSKVGVDHDCLPREKAPCAEVADTNGFVVIEDVALHDHYFDSPIGVDGIRFYAGAPLTTREGYCLGALCVLGREPRKITEAESKALQDLASMVMSQIELQHAFGRIDPISGLANRVKFCDDLADLARDAPDQDRIAVALDLAQPHQMERLSAVMGPAVSEQVVQDAARSLKAFLGRGAQVYHVSATQFAFLAPTGLAAEPCQSLLLKLLEIEFVSADIKYAVTPVCAMTAFSPKVTQPVDCLRALSSAVQEARARGERIGLFCSGHDVDYRRKFRLLNDFATAMENGDQLRLVLQPRVDLATGRILSAEALLRWRHPELGDVAPGEFIPVIENSALAWPLTQWVLGTACSQLGAWKKEGLDLKISFNLAASNLREDVVGEVLSCLAANDIAPQSLEVELTESSVMENCAQGLAMLDKLVEGGVSIAVDDFGTGYSSLAYLQRLPVSTVKIDRSFIMAMSEGARERRLVHSIIKLSHELGYRVVAEGIELAEAADLLRAMGCDEGQGFLFARPLELADFREMMIAEASPVVALSAA